MKICVKCGSEFHPIAHNQRRCPVCRYLTCVVCGKQWVPANSAYTAKYCSRACAETVIAPERNARIAQCRPKYQPKGAARTQWKGDAAQTETKRARARRMYQQLGKCQRCDAPAVLRHHKDEDTGNNHPSNIEFLCDKCHVIHHLGVEPRPCRICQRPTKPMRRGMCNRCYEYGRRHDLLAYPERYELLMEARRK